MINNFFRTLLLIVLDEEVRLFGELWVLYWVSHIYGFMATGFLPVISLTNCVVAIFFYGWLPNDHMNRGYDVYFDIIINISKHNLTYVSRGCIEGTRDNLSDIYHPHRNLDIKTSKWVRGEINRSISQKLNGQKYSDH